MKNLKKIFAVALGLTMMAGVSACKKQETPVDPTPTYDPEDFDVENAKDYLYQQMKGVTETQESYDLPIVNIDDIPYTVTWTLTVKDGGDKNAVKLDGNRVVVVCKEGCPTVETEYTLAYSIKDPNGDERTGSFERKVPTFLVTMDWADLKALCVNKQVEKGKQYPFKGRVTAKSPLANGICKNIYIENETGVVIAYNTSLTQEQFDAIKIGSLIRSVGELSLYYGAVELTGGAITVYEDAVVAPTPTNIDAVYGVAESTTDAAFEPYMNKYVVVTGATLKGYDTNTNYAYFAKGNITETYARLSSSGSYAINTDTEDPNCDYTLLANKWVMGQEATIYGLLLTYNGVYYIQPAVAADVTITNTEVSDETKCNLAAGIAPNDFEKNVAQTTNWTLPTHSTGKGLEDVALAFEVIEGDDVASIAVDPESGNKVLTVKVEKATTVKVKVTATLGTASAEETITIETILPEPITVKAFLDAKDTENVQFVRGTVVASASNVSYKCKVAGTYNTKEYALDAVATVEEFNALDVADQANFEKVVSVGSFVLADTTGAVFSYEKMAVEVGDEVLVSAKYAVNGDTIEQLATIAVLKYYSHGSDKTGALEASYDATSIAALGTTFEGLTEAADKLAFGQGLTGKLVKVTGYVNNYVNKGVTYYNLFSAADTTSNENKIGQIYCNDKITAQLAALNNQEADVYGYIRGIAKAGTGKCANITLQVVGVVAKGGEFAVKGFTVEEKNVQLVGNWAASKSGTSYNTFNGTEKIGDLNITTTNILKNTKNVGEFQHTGIFQLRKPADGAGTLVITGAAIKSIVIKQHSTFEATKNTISYQLGTAAAVSYTPESVDTGKLSGDYAIYELTYTINCGGATSVTIANTGTGAQYFYSIEIVYEK